MADIAVTAGLDASGYDRGAKQIEKANKKIKGSSREAGFIIQNIAEGAADAQYGLRFLANNVEVVANQFGEMRRRAGGTGGALKQLAGALIGPAGVIGLITVLVNYGPQIYNFFRQWIQGADEAAKALDKFEESLAKTGETQESKHARLLGEAIAEAQKNYDAAVDLFNQKVTQGFRRLDDELAAVATTSKKLNDLIEKRGKLNKKNEEAAKLAQQEKTYKLINDQLSFDLQLLGAKKKDLKDIYQYEIDTLSNLSQSLIGTKNYEKVLKRIAILKESIKNIPLEGGEGTSRGKVTSPRVGKFAKGRRKDRGLVPGATSITTSDLDGGLSGALIRNAQNLQQTGNLFDEIGGKAQIAAGLVGAFQSAISGGGDTSGFEKFAKSVIDTAQQIAFALAITAATKDAAKTSSIALPALIGVALGVVSSAFSSNVKGVGGGGRGSGVGGAATTPAPLQRVQGLNAAGGQLIAEGVLRGQDIVLAVRTAGQRRQGLQ